LVKGNLDMKITKVLPYFFCFSSFASQVTYIYSAFHFSNEDEVYSSIVGCVFLTLFVAVISGLYVLASDFLIEEQKIELEAAKRTAARKIEAAAQKTIEEFKAKAES